MKKRYFAPISRVIDLCGEDAFLAGSGVIGNGATGSNPGYGGEGGGIEADAKGGFNSWEED